jgi:hypothetical protein
MPEVVLLQQPRGAVAEELAEALPGLLQLAGSGDKAALVVGDVRKHDKLLEKVGAGCMLCVRCVGMKVAGRLHMLLALSGGAPAVLCCSSCSCRVAALPPQRQTAPNAHPPPPTSATAAAVQVRRLSGEERYAPFLQLRKVKDHFIFTIESTGAWKPHELFSYAVAMMVSKCDKVLEGLQAFPNRSF